MTDIVKKCSDEFADDLRTIMGAEYVPRKGENGMTTLEGYLKEANAKGVIDFNLRTITNPDGGVDFYIHPSNVDGETADFEVKDETCKRLAVGAGSKRPS